LSNEPGQIRLLRAGASRHLSRALIRTDDMHVQRQKKPARRQSLFCGQMPCNHLLQSPLSCITDGPSSCSTGFPQPSRPAYADERVWERCVACPSAEGQNVAIAYSTSVQRNTAMEASRMFSQRTRPSPQISQLQLGVPPHILSNLSTRTTGFDAQRAASRQR